MFDAPFLQLFSRLPLLNKFKPGGKLSTAAGYQSRDRGSIEVTLLCAIPVSLPVGTIGPRRFS
jgi:hypothetical protein